MPACYPRQLILSFLLTACSPAHTLIERLGEGTVLGLAKRQAHDKYSECHHHQHPYQDNQPDHTCHSLRRTPQTRYDTRNLLVSFTLADQWMPWTLLIPTQVIPKAAKGKKNGFRAN